jgi:hypothetical protein
MGGHSKGKAGLGADSYDQKAKLGAATRHLIENFGWLAEVTVRG